jgi:serine/threonine protein kinase
MAYCQECGEKVAENDVFCPYCGISLQPIAVAGREDFSFEKTIVAESPKVSEPQEKMPADEPREIRETHESPATATNEFSSSGTIESFDMKTESVDIPAELMEDINSTGENFASDESSSEIESAPEIEAPAETETPVEAAAPAEDKAEISEPEIKQESEQAPPVPLPENIEILKPIEDSPKAETPEMFSETPKPPVRNNETIDDEGFVMPQPDSIYKPEEIKAEEIKPEEIEAEEVKPEEIEAEEDSNLSGDDSESESDFSEAATSLYPSGSISKEYLSESLAETPAQPEEAEPEFNLENPLPDQAEAAIAKPDVELEQPPRPSSEAVFDSVQIVQREDPSEAKTLEEDLQAAPVSEEAKPTSAENEGRPFTTPNITGSDTGGKSSSKLKPLDEGTVLNNRYEIVRKIGGGGMGAVYLASDKNLGGVLRAVKEMVQSYIEETQQEKAVADFKRESMLLTSLEHQAIPTIFDYFYDEKEARFYLVMKYISGGDLASRLRSAPEGRIDEQTITEWGIQIADVLDYLHNRQPPIVYRDLKPANIMIDGNSGRIMLIDFGIARWINKEEKGVTAVGTMGYAPPELFSGNVESRSDIYSLGSTMFHLLTGADPQSNPLLIFDFQKNPRPRQINPQLSDQMERILMRSVEYNSDKRFTSAAEMRQYLQEHLDNLKANRVTFGVKETPVSVTLSEEPVFCGFCGQKIVATDMFCAFCGAKQPIAQQGVHISAGGVYFSPSLTAKLLILGTNDLDSPSFYLDKDENLVGRRDPMSNIFPEIDLSKYDPQTKISRRHARIWRDGNNFMVEDLGSSNGTILLPVVNETVRLLPHQPHLLSNGDKLKVGDTTMHFVVG